MSFTSKDLHLDHFAFYDFDPSKIDELVGLQCQFDEEPEPAEVMYAERVGLASEKNNEGMLDVNHNFVWCHIAEWELEPVRVVVFEDQFGDGKLVIGRASGLLVPTRRDRCGKPEKLSHYKVFEVIEKSEPRKVRVPVTSAYNPGMPVTVGSPAYFAVPTTKDHRGRTHRIHNEDAHLVIYDVSIPGVEWQPGIVRMRDQFGRRRRWRSRMTFFGVPCLKREWEEA